jgi:hypothetical protein
VKADRTTRLLPYIRMTGANTSTIPYAFMTCEGTNHHGLTYSAMPWRRPSNGVVCNTVGVCVLDVMVWTESDVLCVKLDSLNGSKH